MNRRRPLALLACCVLAALAGVTAASAVTNGEPGGGEPPPDPSPQPGSAVVDQRTADPGGGPEWATRRYATKGGSDCVEVGRYAGGDFGTVDSDGSVRPHAPGRGGPCGDLAADPAIVAVNRYAANGSRSARTVLFGVAGPDVVAVRSGSPGGTGEDLRLGEARTFLLVRSGLHDPTAFPVDVELSDGRIVSHRWR